MKKLSLIAIAALMLAACSSDPMKERLASTVKPDVGYKFRSYTVTDTVTNEEMVGVIASRYHMTEVEQRSEFEKWRDNLAEEVERDKNRLAELGAKPDMMNKEATATLALMDSLLSVYDRVDKYSIDYHRAENRFFSHMAYFLDAPQLKEYAPDRYALESKSGVDDFAKIAELRKEPSAVYGYMVTHEYSVANPIVENGDRLIMRDDVFFDKDWEIIDVKYNGIGNH